MPEITEAEQTERNQYLALGTPREVKAKIAALEKDNKKQRDEIRAVKEKLPKNDQVIVKKEEKKAYDAYVKLGKADELKSKVEAGDKAQVELKQVKTRNAVGTFTKAAGLHAETIDTLIALPALNDAKFEIREVKVNGEKKEVAYVTLKDKEAMTFEDAKKQIPALKGLRAEESEAGTPFITQNPGEKRGSKGDIYAKIRKAAEDKQKAKAATAKTTVPQDSLLLGLGMN